MVWTEIDMYAYGLQSEHKPEAQAVVTQREGIATSSIARLVLIRS